MLWQCFCSDGREFGNVSRPKIFMIKLISFRWTLREKKPAT